MVLARNLAYVSTELTEISVLYFIHLIFFIYVFIFIFM